MHVLVIYKTQNNIQSVDYCLESLRHMYFAESCARNARDSVLTQICALLLPTVRLPLEKLYELFL